VTDVLAEPPPLTPAGERIATAAAELFYAHGIRAVGVDTIPATAGATKRTLYDRFGSKDALVTLYLVRRARHWQAFLVQSSNSSRPARPGYSPCSTHSHAGLAARIEGAPSSTRSGGGAGGDQPAEARRVAGLRCLRSSYRIRGRR
jgi:AcrR family transcriptional regulator